MSLIIKQDIKEFLKKTESIFFQIILITNKGEYLYTGSTFEPVKNADPKPFDVHDFPKDYDKAYVIARRFCDRNGLEGGKLVANGLPRHK